MKSSQKSYTATSKAKIYSTLALLLVALTLLSLVLGAEKLDPIKAIIALFEGGSSSSARIMRFVRLPRTLAAIVAGTALATSGAIIQSVLSNSLASPSTIGVNAGAGLAVALFSALFPTMISLVPFASLIGAFLGALLVISIGEKTGSSRIGLVLSGVAVSAIFSAGIDAVLTFVPEALNGYSDFRIGGLFAVSMNDLKVASPLIAGALLLSLLMHNELDVLMLGMDEAKSLGLNSKAVRMEFLALSAVMAGSAISFTGLIGFVGLIVPHIMRRFVGEESLHLIATSAILGAILLLGSDLLSRLLFAPYELPVGIVMALIGGPFFIVLLRKRGSSHD